jgi:protein-L-isoaspartate(D-aspartate) O-methyltransferase
MSPHRATLDDVRGLYAAMMTAVSGSSDPRMTRIFETLPREAFLPPGPWTLVVGGRRVPTPTADPIHLYQNVLIALDATQSINNGEPFLHAGWLGASAPAADDAITHIGAGTGYYTAMLAMLALPNGRVTAFEIDAPLAETAKRNLEPFENVEVQCANAVTTELPPSDLIYVNAGVYAPPLQWLTALRPGGRLIFPWRPTDRIGLAALVTRTPTGFTCAIRTPAWFIPCIGASDPPASSTAPDYAGAWRTRSLRLTSIQAPDKSATAIYPDVWFSDAAV